MTVAVDIKTGKVVGQVLAENECQREDRMLTGMRRILTRDGVKSVPESSVRLERVN